MLRGPHAMAIAVRRPDGGLFVHRQRLTPAGERWIGWRLPFLRGIVALVDSLGLGVRALLISAEAAGEERLSPWQGATIIGLASILAVGLFMLLPTVAVGGIAAWLTWPASRNLVEGMLRLTILVGYVIAIARVPDIGRIFAYHGAEHRVIHLVETGGERTVAAARGMPILHPRCGTSFLLFVAAVSVLVFAFFGWPSLWQRVLLRLMLLPVVAGIAYEAIRLSGRSRHPLAQAMALPGLWLQRLTTREPGDDQVEVALAALKAVTSED
ncbi:MAG TPA: DUF1385 domain-containing protein [Clostridiales bacterium]|nr:DUF1385 domain-containing protein [Clostridiales bacterium]